MRGEHNSTSYDSAVIYRGFWAVLMLLGVVSVVTASFLIICAAPFASHLLYKAGGGSYIAADFVKRRNYAGEQSWWDLPIDIDDELFEDTRMSDASCRSVW
ncbi:transmembrane protein 182 isoform X2 [Mesoplodon densirostris]|uniref:transmembrane protein 182 isoform X2 n=1 Tax=Mesoplodon densirostris TaxID=48708 RepID=UPI0028DB68A9|nr:transmembrane protein 182 isoform X2 [Mesoplodon densirostris]XP_059973779.1 transmembrane protein 182 isoform X2 [Mesoplodon densirostris]XP_059973780.1 transmembrane protein 182 isoform X2 [Mesoplodon densirostris]XP_059973781.1 transmembrane protein 182 isoform X2 [Mesoplodon densirostris]XP_059973782.1 transmembrane protein 182 isoform X2 [Mesoplodon densirostris]